ncbi:MAG TPA: glycosyl hydrolase [Phycisphaerae bacterium]|nr:glycosyl hydrolase [Phycisphaerae bacterium]
MKIRGFFAGAVAGAVMLAAMPAFGQGASDALTAGFLNPPDSAKPQTWWHWMNGNVSKAGITLDLEAMKRMGLGGAHLAQVGSDIPKGPVPYDSPEMRDCVRFALSEADRLGLTLCMFNCPGWSSSGGPWITPELSMKALVTTETAVKGGQQVSAVLAQPAAKMGFYRDAYVIAFPAEQTDARIANFNGPPARGRAATPPAPRADASTPAIDKGKVVDLTKDMDASGKLTWDAPAGDWTVLRIGYTTNGTQNHPGPDGGVGLEVDKFSKEALDFHFDHFFGPFYDAMKPLAEKGKMAALIDSYETGTQDWTADFPAEFKKRRGYDMTPYMAVMAEGRVVGSLAESERFLWDVRKTKAELMDENYYGHFTELCHQHGMLSFFEPYDTVNFDEMVAGSYADMPMGEFWQGQENQRSIKLVASVMHMNGRPVMGAESFTSQSRWTEYPYSLKALGDFMWTQGLNKFVFHRFAMQPNPNPDVVPGMTMGPWGGHFDRTNTWWSPEAGGDAWIKYIQRSQFLLQQGLFVGDLLYFSGEDSPVRNPDESKLEPAPPEGHGYDTIDTKTLATRIKIVDGKLTLPDGLTYKVLVLPANTTKTMTPELAKELHDLVRDGMTLVVNGPKSTQSPSLKDYPAADGQVAGLTGEMWGDMDGTASTEHDLGAGHVYWGVPLEQVLAKLHAPADFECTSRSGEAEVHYIHKHTNDAEIYFVANRGQKAEDLVCTFNVSGKEPELWDADSAVRGPVAVYGATGDGRTRVALQLAPSGSVFVIFRQGATVFGLGEAREPKGILVSQGPGSAVLATTVPYPTKQFTRQSAPPYVRLATAPMALPAEDEPAAVELMAGPHGEPVAFKSGTYESRWSAKGEGGRTILPVQVPAPTEIAGPWQVAFQAHRGAPAEATFDKLISWPDSSDKGIKYFSGTATYTNHFTAPTLGANQRLFLDLGRVQVIAKVAINGKEVGTLWKLPFRLDVTDAVKPGDNQLEVKVTNLWPNRLIGDESLPPDNQYKQQPRMAQGEGPIVAIPEWYAKGEPKPASPRITFTTWHHWNAGDPLFESGLIGPVKLRVGQVLAP